METAVESTPSQSLDSAVATEPVEPKDAILASDATPHPTGGRTEEAKEPRKGAEAEKEAVKQAAIDLKAKVKAKINDREEELSIEDLIKGYQTGKASDEKFQEAKKIQNEIKELREQRERELALLKQDPWAVLKEQGLDPDELAERRLLEKIRLESMDPNERRAHDLEQENLTLKERAEKWEAQQKEQQERLEQERKDKLKYEQVQSIDKELTQTLHERGLKPTPQVLEAVAQHMLAHLTTKGGNHNITAKEALDFVLEQQESDFSGRLEGEDIEALMNRLSPKRRDAIRKWFVSQVTNGQTTGRSQPTQPRAAKSKSMSTDDFFKNMETKYG